GRHPEPTESSTPVARRVTHAEPARTGSTAVSGGRVPGGRVGDMERPVEGAVRVSIVDDVAALGCAAGALALLATARMAPERHGIAAKQLAPAVELECARRLVHDDAIGAHPVGEPRPRPMRPQRRADEREENAGENRAPHESTTSTCPPIAFRYREGTAV